MKMQAARLYGKNQIRIVETDIPAINDNEILLKIRSAAICGTDVRMFQNGAAGVDDQNPLVLGHEVSGVIDRVGSNVTRYNAGMRVAVAPNMGCGVCRYCTSGRTHLCADYKAFGINLDGGFAQYMRIPEAAVRQGNIIEIKETVSFDEAAINEPFSCAYNGFSQYGVFPGDKVLIIGAGPIGLMHAKLARMAGAAKVMIHDLSESRLEQCRQIDPFFNTISKDSLKEDVLRLTGSEGLDVCVIACPSPTAQSDSLELMGIGGRICFFGGLPKAKEIVPINTNLIHYKQLVITGSTRASVPQYRQTLDFISSGIVSVKEFISGRFTLEEIHKAFELAGNAVGIKSIIYFE
ncbi:MAG: zinc-dependent dehydrogenase [Saccharofermentanales bacterium]